MYPVHFSKNNEEITPRWILSLRIYGGFVKAFRRSHTAVFRITQWCVDETLLVLFTLQYVDDLRSWKTCIS